MITRVHFDYVEVSGEVIEDVTVQNPAIVAFDLARAKFGWPKRDDADMLFGTFIIWSQLKADGRYTGDFKTFRDHDCTAFGDYDDEPAGDVDPTLPDHEESSVSPSQSGPE